MWYPHAVVRAADLRAVLAGRVVADTGADAQAAAVDRMALNIGSPFGIESPVRTLRRLSLSGRDPLTGCTKLTVFPPLGLRTDWRHHGTGAHLIITMINFDNFAN